MSTNTTFVTTSKVLLNNSVSDETTEYIFWAFHYVIFPSTSILGMVGNLATIVVLTRQRFKKCSNILLVALAVSDMFLLTGLCNFPTYVMTKTTPVGFRFSESVNYILCVFYLYFSSSHDIGTYCSMIIPALITGERILAIFFPLKFRFIVTPLRTIFVLSCLFLLSASAAIYRNAFYFQFKQVHIQGVHVGRIVFSDVYYQDVKSGAFEIFNNIVNNMTGIVPIVLVTVGCAVIGFQVRVINNRRRKMISGEGSLSMILSYQKSISRTTKTLISVCLLYIVCSGFVFMIAFVTSNTPLDNVTVLSSLLGLVSLFLLCINSIGNFIIYVAINKTFRDSAKKMFCSLKKKWS